MRVISLAEMPDKNLKMWPSQAQGIFHVLQPIMDFNVIYGVD